MESHQLGQKVLDRIKHEQISYVPQKANACIIWTNDAGEEKVYWIMPGGLKYSNTPLKNIVGDTVGVESGPPTLYNISGEPCVSKNSPLGNAISESGLSLGELQYKVNNQEFQINVISNAEYQVKYNDNDAFDGQIQSIADNGIIFQESLFEELFKEREKIELILRSVEVSEADRVQMQQMLNEIDIEIAEKRKKARKRRRTSTSIRQKFFLDPEQNVAKRSKLLNGPLIINGGPGTGKTTLLIHRIQYMLDAEIENDELLTITLNNDDKAFLRNQDTGWIFYSPTELLKKYLQNAMAAEGLKAHDGTVKTWEQQRASLKTTLGLYNQANPLFQAFKSTESLWNLTSQQIQQFQLEFDSFTRKHFHSILLKVNAITGKDTPWKKEIDAIKSVLEPSVRDFKLENFILALNDLYNNYSALRISIEKDYKAIMDLVSANIQHRLSAAETELLVNLLKERRSKEKIVLADAEEEDEQNDAQEFEDELIGGVKKAQDINRLIRKSIRKEALSSIDQGTRLTKNEKKVLDIIRQHIDANQYPAIAANSLFIKYFKPLLNGADTFILSRFWALYKSFRKDVLKSAGFLSSNTKEILTVIVNAEPKNSGLHDDEIDLVVYLSLRMARLFYMSSPAVFRESTHPIIANFKIHMKGLVAVDEATDFEPIQIAAMYMLSRPRLNSFTLTGDLMQQMNERGLVNWNDLNEILPGLEIKSLVKSYRQTPKLLKLASALYKNRYGEEPGFFSAEEDDADDPDPLYIMESDFKKKIDWVSERIAELYTNYDRVIPNIAIFVRDNDLILPITDALNDTHTFTRYSIQAKACLGEGEIGSVEFVRVFNINLIKGMEFEAVFFMDIDEYPSREMDIMDKLIYVGISRATYYLAVTLSHQFPDRLLPVKDLLVENSNWSGDVVSDY